MAAYAALVSLMQIIHQIENRPFPPIRIDKQQVESLTEIVISLQEFLEGYTSPAADSDDADAMEMRIADAAYAAEDVIESYIVHVMKLGKKISCIHFYQDLHQVIEDMNLIKKEAMMIYTEKVVVKNQPQQNISAFKSMTMVGVNDVFLEIIDKLTSDDEENIQVIPIVGMGGIGKTTLARNIFLHPRIKERFDICVWATISQRYNTKEILCEILSQDNQEKKERLSKMSEHELGLKLHQYVSYRRFLIVMDDMWDIDAWYNIHHFLPNNENCSRILVTTRQLEVSSYLNNNYSLQMKFLNEGSSWDLFLKTLFGETSSCPPELENIGKKIVENCRGLPLSIVVVGGLLKKMEHDKGCWESIRKNFTSIVSSEDVHCLKVLKMSYNHLPIHLKPCFLYMGVFEEDREIRVSTLIKLWISEGVLKPKNGEIMEKTAIGFLKDLIDRNLILVDKLGSTGNIKCCKVHDLLRLLCWNEAEKSGFYHVIGRPNPQGKNMHRRVVILSNTSEEQVSDALQSMSHVRSIIHEKRKVLEYQNFGLLRTLHAYGPFYGRTSYWNYFEFQAVNLQYLDAQICCMCSYFPWVNLFWNVQTLVVFSDLMSCAPVEIWKMPQFRHIKFTNYNLHLPDPPSGNINDIVIMENLQTLKGVDDLKLGDELVVKRIPNIKSLKIRYNYEVDNYCLGNITFLSKLESLNYREEERWANHLHRLTFPHSLKKLTLTLNIKFYSEIDGEDMEKIGSLPLLEKLILRFGYFREGKWETVEGQFPRLKYLSLLSCGGLKHWTIEGSFVFPLLEQLLLFGLSELEEIPSEIGERSCLKQIRLRSCSESVVCSAKNIVEEQMDEQGEQLPFRVVLETWERNEALESLVSPNFEVDFMHAKLKP